MSIVWVRFVVWGRFPMGEVGRRMVFDRETTRVKRARDCPWRRTVEKREIQSTYPIEQLLSVPSRGRRENEIEFFFEDFNG